MMTHTRSAATGAGRYDIEAIKRRLPHRYPFLMVDRIEESGPGYAIGVKNVTANEPCFQGHFPQRSILPGVLIAEALMQTSAFVGRPAEPDGAGDAMSGVDAAAADQQLFAIGVNLKFRRPVVPGDRLRMELRFVRMAGDMLRFKASARTEAGFVASGDLSLAIVTTQEDWT